MSPTQALHTLGCWDYKPATYITPRHDITLSIIMYSNHMLCISSPVMDKNPTLPELLSLEIPLQVGVKYETFGIFLLDDKAGKKVDIIKEDCRGNTEKIIMEILKEWLNGKGTEVSWKSLVKILRKCKVNFLADQIEMAAEQL